MARLYLDLNCFNRPFDDQRQSRVAVETDAVFAILHRIEDGEDELVWSGALTFENSQNPMADRRVEIARWADRAVVKISITDEISERARELLDAGVQPLDAVHLACAEAGSTDRFLTCDDRLLRRARRVNAAVQAQNPADYLEEIRR
jgi:predicted nucleic acid-binding protein